MIRIQLANKIRVAFIDSELAKRRQAPVSNLHEPPNHREEQPEHVRQSSRSTGPMTQKLSSAKPTAARQLAEVDLGDTAHDLNLARTQAALERVKAGQVPIEDEVKLPRPRKPRLGRDGKPMRPRPRKRRNSEDVARDVLVEQFLHENKIDMYEPSTSQRPNDTGRPGADGGDDGDDKFAEQFRQDFMDAMAERRTRTKTTTQTKGAVAAEPRGPKLGGSRSARAKMAQMQQQQQAGK